MNKSGNSIVNVSRITHSVKPSRGFLFGILIMAALVAFEIFNYSTTDFALTDLLGDLRFAGLRWATILAMPFVVSILLDCPFVHPEKGAGEPKEVWYLFGAWLLAATMNAILTWWGVAIAILGHESLGGSVVSRETMIKIVPVFVAIMVWVIRVLIIGSFSVNGSRLFSQASPRQAVNQCEAISAAAFIFKPSSIDPRSTVPQCITACAETHPSSTCSHRANLPSSIHEWGEPGSQPDPQVSSPAR